MLEAIAKRLLRAVLGGGADINAANPLPVDTSPGSKTVATIITLANLAGPATSGLVDCAAIDLRGGPNTLALTIKARYGAATQGIRIHVRTSPTNSATGTHTAVFAAAVMTDAAAHFIVDELIGLTILNVTTGASAVITDNDETTVAVAAIAGGWTTLDVYSIAGADYDTPTDWDTWNPSFVANTVLRQTKHYDTHPLFVKVLVENLDPAVAVTDIRVISVRGV